MLKVIVHYSEIGLKGKNKPFFEKKLRENIKDNSKKNNLKVNYIKMEGSRISIEYDSLDKELVTFVLKNTFGIQFFAFANIIKKDLNSILEEVKKNLIKLKEKGENDVSFDVRRNDKAFQLNSPELKSKFGEIALDLGIKVDYKNSKNKINLIITLSNAFIFDEYILGFAGLPVGSSGRVLVLLSGGIDSPVCAWNMMRRGVKCDFIHFHTYSTNEEVLNTKIKDTIQVLNKYQNKTKLYLVPYSPYEFLTSGKIYENYELVFFKHYLFKVSERIAKDYRYDALANGDNLCQVASQTIENISVSESEIKIPIFRPLLCYEKEEIVTKAKEIGTYELSIKEYKDCCSLFAKNPATKANQKKFDKILSWVELDKIVEKSLEQMQMFEIN